MSVWNTYEARFNAPVYDESDPKRYAALDHAQSRMQRKITASLSYQNVKVDGKDRRLSIADDASNYNTKKIFSMPGEDLPHGSIVHWNDAIWLVTEVSVKNDIYTKGKMRQCNYYLKWIDDKGNIIGRWCVVEDGTKYLIGERQEDIIAVGDARMAVTIGKDKDTNKLKRGMRFLIDDMDSEDVLAYQITKPNKLFNVYNGRGVFRFIMNEDTVKDVDNIELRIADYYNWKPKPDALKPYPKVDSTFEDIADAARDQFEHRNDDIEDRKVWL